MFSVVAVGLEDVKVITVDQLNSLLKKKSAVSLYDVNVDSTREHVGIIPGAKLINSSSQYDLAATLPPIKSSPLVFYCANEMCSSSDIAAKRAVAAGYQDVSVMKAGVYGWKKAGKALKLVQVQKSSATEPANVEPGEAMALTSQNHAIIVDVRENEERHEIIAGEKWFPMSKASDENAWAAFKSTLPKDKTIIFHCAAGFRSKKMAERLSHEGMSSLYFSGVDQWKSAGLPIVAGPAR